MGITDWITSKLAIDTSHRIDAIPLLVRGDYDPARMPEWYANRTPNWATWDNDGLRSDAVRKSIIVFACLTYLSDAVAEARLTVESEVNGEWEPSQDRAGTALDNLLAFPNPHMSESEMLGLLVMQMGIQGYAVVEKTRNNAGLPVQLWPLRPDWLHQQRTADGGWAYQYRAPGLLPRPIPEEDLSFIPWRLDDRMERHGIGPVQVAGREIGIDASLTDFLKTFLDAGGIPPYVIMYDDAITDEAQIESMQEKWKQKYGGSKAWGSLPVFHGGYKLEQIGQSINDMAWPDLRSLTELKICQVFRVPPDLVGAYKAFDSGNLTTTEAQGAMEQLQRYGAAPLRRTISGALGRELLPEFVGDDRRYRVVFDTSDVLALQEDTDQKHARAREDWNAGIIMLDEARIDTDREPLPKGQGEVFKVGFNTILTPAAALIYEMPKTTTTTQPPALPANTPKALPAPERTYRNVAALDTKALEFRSNALTRVQRDRIRLSEIGTRQLRGFFKAQGARITDELVKHGVDHETRDIANVDWDAEEEELAKILRRFYLANGEAAWAVAGQLLDYDLVWSVTNPRILQLLEILGLRIVGISETTRADVVEAIAKGTQEGDSIAQLADRIRGMFEETYLHRSETIARTETMIAYSDASILAYGETGEVDECEIHDNPLHTEWYKGAADGLTCAQRHGLVVPLAQASFHVHSDHPNGSAGVIPILRVPLGVDP